MTPAEYDARYDSPRGRWIGNTELRLVCRHLRMAPGTSLLDVGCGTGWFTRRLAAAGLEVTGLDIDPDALVFARRHSPSHVAYVEGDARCLPFADHSFDQVISIAALGFIDDWPGALSEIVRVTRDRFVLGLLNRSSLLWRDKGRDGGTGGYAGAHWHTWEEITPVLGALNVQEVHRQTAVVFPSGTVPARMIEALLPGWLPWGAFLIVSGKITS